MFRFALVVGLTTPLCAGQVFISESYRPSAEETKKILQAVSHTPTTVSGGKATLTRVLTGKFSQPDVPELIADFEGQEPHALDFGGTVLLRQVKGEWQFIRYQAGFRSTECRKFPRTDHTDLLVCQGGHTAMGENTTYVFTYDWKLKKDAQAILLQMTDDRTTCGKSYSAAKFTAFEVADYDDNGFRDLGVTVKAGRYPCGRGMSTFEIHFLFDGKGFHVSPDSAAAKRKLDALMRR